MAVGEPHATLSVFELIFRSVNIFEQDIQNLLSKTANVKTIN